MTTAVIFLKEKWSAGDCWVNYRSLNVAVTSMCCCPMRSVDVWRSATSVDHHQPESHWLFSCDVAVLRATDCVETVTSGSDSVIGLIYEWRSAVESWLPAYWPRASDVTGLTRLRNSAFLSLRASRRDSEHLNVDAWDTALGGFVYRTLRRVHSHRFNKENTLIIYIHLSEKQEDPLYASVKC